MDLIKNQTAKNLFLLFGLIFISLILTELFNPTSIRPQGDPLKLENQRFPIILGKNGAASFKLSLPNMGSEEHLAFDLTANGPVIVATPILALKGNRSSVVLGSKGEFCSQQNAEGFFKCHLPLKKNLKEQTLLVFPADEEESVNISNIAVRYLKIIRKTSLEKTNLPFLFALLVILILVTWLLHKNREASQWFIVAVTTSGLLWLQPVFTVCLLFFLWMLFSIGKRMPENPTRRPMLWSVLVGCLGFLLFFKYGTIYAKNIFPDVGGLNLLMPLGLSYFIIRAIDSQLRFFRGELSDVTFREYLCYMIFPPTIPAGPIETLEGFREHRLEAIKLEDILYGLGRIGVGMAKKLVLVDMVFSRLLFMPATGLFYQAGIDPAAAGTDVIVLTLLFSFFLVYLDFSAYSDIAIGFGRLLGYRISENFNWPFLAGNIREYWRNWHMTLSNWCMRNIYFPLTISTKNIYLPLYAIMITVGLWHSLSITWFSWGLHHATGLMLLAFFEKRFGSFQARNWLRFGRPLRILMTVLFISAAHSFVSYSEPGTAFAVYANFWRGLFELLTMQGNWTPILWNGDFWMPVLPEAGG